MTDLPGATRLCAELLAGELVTPEDSDGTSVAELAWPNGVRLRLTRTPKDTARTQLHFTRDMEFSPAELHMAAVLAGRLGTALHLGGS